MSVVLLLCVTNG
ncbi:hypothetical protein Zm00014a_020975 [Zea mays]|uniref:Uncharacterized protein n=1 Tax=Zea mays TaxID=4577 RepID=A0A3L6ED26_MAIZE|nr:hypothetical protein Zm00014a_020975 [Zea mays]